MFVNPGSVLISFNTTLPSLCLTKKSTLESPLPSSALNALTAYSLICSIVSLGRSAGILSSVELSLYFASKS